MNLEIGRKYVFHHFFVEEDDLAEFEGKKCRIKKGPDASGMWYVKFKGSLPFWVYPQELREHSKGPRHSNGFRVDMQYRLPYVRPAKHLKRICASCEFGLGPHDDTMHTECEQIDAGLLEPCS